MTQENMNPSPEQSEEQFQKACFLYGVDPKTCKLLWAINDAIIKEKESEITQLTVACNRYKEAMMDSKDKACADHIQQVAELKTELERLLKSMGVWDAIKLKDEEIVRLKLEVEMLRHQSHSDNSTISYHNKRSCTLCHNEYKRGFDEGYQSFNDTDENMKEIASLLSSNERYRQALQLLVDEIEKLVDLLRKEPSMQSNSKWGDTAHSVQFRIRIAKEALHTEGEGK